MTLPERGAKPTLLSSVSPSAGRWRVFHAQGLLSVQALLKREATAGPWGGGFRPVLRTPWAVALRVTGRSIPAGWVGSGRDSGDEKGRVVGGGLSLGRVCWLHRRPPEGS